MGRRHVVLGAAFNPLYGPFELLGDDAKNHFFSVEVELASEATAHIGSDDAHFVLGVAGDEGEEQTHQVRDLG